MSNRVPSSLAGVLAAVSGFGAAALSRTRTAATRLRAPSLGIQVSPLNKRRLENFRANKRAFYSLIIFGVLFVVAMLADVIANDKPLLVYYDGEILSPILIEYPESKFGGFLEAEADYADPYIQDLIKEGGGWMVWPLIPYSYDTIMRDKDAAAPAPPDWQNLLGTDIQHRDVLANVIHGFRMAVTFALILTFFSTVIGVAAGAVQGYFGGWLDLIFQRFIEILQSIPSLYVIIILSAVLFPGFWVLLIVLLFFSWTALVGVVRAEFLRGRNFDYVRAARALGVSDTKIMFRHILPNAMVATLTFIPFLVTQGVATLTALDFLGFGLPPGTPSLGELVQQGKNNLHAPWLGMTAFFVLALLLSLLVFIGEGARDAFDPKKSVEGAKEGGG